MIRELNELQNNTTSNVPKYPFFIAKNCIFIVRIVARIIVLNNKTIKIIFKYNKISTSIDDKH